MFRRNESRLASKISLTLVFALLFSGTILTSHTTSANDTHVDDVSIIVPISCNLNSTNATHSKTVNPNTTEEDIGKTTLQAFCNDNNGFAIYAIGYTGDIDGTTTLVGNNTSQTISTSTNTSSSSSWSMKVTKETSSSIAYLPTNMTINNGYDSYSVVPTNWTKVATFSSATDTAEPNGKGAVLYTTYKVHIAPGQAADVYSGKVKYTLFHPSTSCLYYTVKFNPGDGSGYMADQPICNNGSTALSTNTFTPPAGYEFKEWNTKQDGSGTSYSDEQIINTNLADIGESITLYAVWSQRLYNKVSSLVKTYGGSPQTQTLADMQAVITEPTSSNPATDTSNSGVFIYDSTTFGEASDASNDYPIYYYRGIIDSNLSDSYSTDGSIGNGAYYPNYIKLGNNTCWRIVRTTGSGGIKMIYNGLYGDTTSGSCANSGVRSTTKTRVTFKSDRSYRQYIGYTHSNISSTNFVSVNTVFGDNTNYSTTNTINSTIKDYIENTWYANNMTTYTNILEPSAGYCNDRLLYEEDGEELIIDVIPQGNVSSGSTFFSGARIRNNNVDKKLTLTCPRGTVDLYTTSSASDGNHQLNAPAAMLTVDEIALSGLGAGNRTSTTAYSSNSSYKSYLKSYTDNTSWTISPSGDLAVFMLYNQLSSSSGASVSYNVVYARPAISLIHSTTIASGSGTATDPWLIDE